MSARSKKHVIIPKFRNHYTPPFSDFCEVLNLKVGPHHLISEIENQTGRKINISTKTLKKFTSQEGVSEKVFSQAKKYFRDVVTDSRLKGLTLSFGTLRKLLTSIHYRSNSASWFGPVLGFRQSGEHNEFYLVFKFLDDRFERDLKFLKSAKHFKATNPNTKQQVEFSREFIYNNTHVDRGLAEDFFLALQGKQSEETTRIATVRYALGFYSDFYLYMMAYYELGCAKILKKHEQPAMKSFFCDIIESYNQNEDEEKYYFSIALDKLSIILNIGQREFASFIPVQQKSNSDQTVNDEQYRQLKKWKKHCDLPSSEKLWKMALSMISDDNDVLLAKVIRDKLMIALAMDRWCKLWREHLLQEGLESNMAQTYIDEAINKYKDYYRTVLNEEKGRR